MGRTQPPAEFAPTEDDRQQYEATLLTARDREERVAPTVHGRGVTWAPQEGSQVTFLQCPLFECLYHGTRGPGKTDALLWSFAQRIDRGHGSAWRGILFRQTYPQLADIQAKSEKWFRQVFPEAKFNRTKMMWEWPGGEVLLLRHMQRPDDYWNYHGHEYPWIGWEELTSWPDARCYLSMMACCRSSEKGVPRMVRATTNPYGVGHNWVKDRFRLSGQWWKTKITLDSKDDQGQTEPPRIAIHGHIDENKILLAATPEYKQITSASASNKAMADAWLSGSWDIVAGGMFDEVWSPRHNIVPEFAVPISWRIDRSFDWGSSAPFSVGWWAESDGTDVNIPGRGLISTVRGDLFRIREWYGWAGRPNQGVHMLAQDISEGIVQREMMWNLDGRVKAGPADTSIWNVENGMCIATDMSKPVRVGQKMHKGVGWTRADKSPGSRATGWELVRKMMRNAHPAPRGRLRERPGLFVVGEECEQFLRTVPYLPRRETNMDDIDDKAEDHVADEVRYRVRAVGMRATQGRTVGVM